MIFLKLNIVNIYKYINYIIEIRVSISVLVSRQGSLSYPRLASPPHTSTTQLMGDGVLVSGLILVFDSRDIRSTLIIDRIQTEISNGSVWFSLVLRFRINVPMLDVVDGGNGFCLCRRG